MEEQTTMGNGTPSYWNSVLIGGLIIALIMTVLGLVSQYMTINSEPVGKSFGMGQAIGTIACLIAAIGGFISTRHYAKENDITFKLGKGALIGLFVGIVGVVASTVLSLLWTSIIDPDLNQALYNWSVANLDAQNLPREQYEMMLGFIPEPGSIKTIITSMAIGLVVVGVLNAISGMIGAKVFASEEE